MASSTSTPEIADYALQLVWLHGAEAPVIVISLDVTPGMQWEVQRV